MYKYRPFSDVWTRQKIKNNLQQEIDDLKVIRKGFTGEVCYYYFSPKYMELYFQKRFQGMAGEYQEHRGKVKRRDETDSLRVFQVSVCV